MLADLSKYIDTRTVFGKPFTIGKVTLVPVIRVSFGLGSGGGSTSGGGGAGAKLTPLAVIVIKDDEVTVHSLAKSQTDRITALTDVLPEAAGKWAELLSHLFNRSESVPEERAQNQEDKPITTAEKVE